MDDERRDDQHPFLDSSIDYLHPPIRQAVRADLVGLNIPPEMIDGR
jgi:hypothetical protein